MCPKGGAGVVWGGVGGVGLGGVGWGRGGLFCVHLLWKTADKFPLLEKNQSFQRLSLSSSSSSSSS